MSTSCPFGIAFAVRPSAVAFSSTQPFSSCTKPFARSTYARGVGEEGLDILFELLAREAQLQKQAEPKALCGWRYPLLIIAKEVLFYRFDATALFFQSIACGFYE